MFLRTYKYRGRTKHVLRCDECSKEFRRPAHGWKPPDRFPTHFCSRSCRTTWLHKQRRGDGRTVLKSGYVQVFVSRGSAGADVNGHIAEHRLVMQRHLGRTLRSNELVHHINGDRSDNQIENLRVESRSAHRLSHAAVLQRLKELELKFGQLTQYVRLLESRLADRPVKGRRPHSGG